MTVRLFPLFFRFDFQFTPVQICLLSCMYPLCISVIMQACRKIGHFLGGLQSALLFHFLGTACLWYMCYFRHLYIVVPLFLLRGGLMNSLVPIVRAIVMDLVTPEMRSRWSCMQTITTFAWSCSAVLGGLVADAASDYRITFQVAALIYSVSFLLLLLAVLIYPSQQGPAMETPASVRPAARVVRNVTVPTATPVVQLLERVNAPMADRSEGQEQAVHIRPDEP